jgi:hypothetical protein
MLPVLKFKTPDCVIAVVGKIKKMKIKFDSKKIVNNIENVVLQKAKQSVINKIKSRFPEVEDLNVEYSQSEQQFKITGKGLTTEQITEALKD